MNWVEIALLVLGAGAFIASFIIPEKHESDDEAQRIDEEIIRTLIEREFSGAKERVVEVVDETLEYAVEKTERASERISNEKIMAINDYSETVLADINKAHQEVLFLYDMLNDKHNNIKETVKHVDKTAKEAEAAVNAVEAIASKIQPEIKEEAVIENIKSNADLETPSYIKAEKAKAAKEKEYARRQMARLILPVQQEAVSPVLTSATTNNEENELKPLVVKNVEIISNKGMPNEVKHVEPYSLVQQAPKFDRNGNEEISGKIPYDNKTNNSNIDNSANGENNNDRILSLHKKGMSNIDIAKELGLGVGEVKLVINLFKGAI